MGPIKLICLAFLFALINAEDLKCDKMSPYPPMKLYCFMNEISVFLDSTVNHTETGIKLIDKHSSFFNKRVNYTVAISDVLYNILPYEELLYKEMVLYLQILEDYDLSHDQVFRAIEKIVNEQFNTNETNEFWNDYKKRIKIPTYRRQVSIIDRLLAPYNLKKINDSTIQQKAHCENKTDGIKEISNRMEEVLLNNCNDTASEEANINVLFMDLLNFIGLHSSNSLNSNLYDDYLKMEQDIIDRLTEMGFKNAQCFIKGFKNESGAETFDNVNVGLERFNRSLPDNQNELENSFCIPIYIKMRYGKDKAQKFLQYLLLQSTTIVEMSMYCSALMFHNNPNTMLQFVKEIREDIFGLLMRVQTEYLEK